MDQMSQPSQSRTETSFTLLTARNETFESCETPLPSRITVAEREKLKKEKLKDECAICLLKNKDLGKLHFCIFCCTWVCSKHLIKKREDPLYSGQYERICSSCENKFLLEKLIGKYQNADEVLTKAENEAISQLKAAEEKQKMFEDKLQYLQTEREKQALLHAAKIDKYNQMLCQGNTRLQELVEVAEIRHQEQEQLIEKNKQMQNTKLGVEEENKRVDDEYKILITQLNAINAQLVGVQKELNEKEQMMARHKMGVKDSKIRAKVIYY